MKEENEEKEGGERKHPGVLGGGLVSTGNSYVAR